MPVLAASDHAGRRLRLDLIAHLQARGLDVHDLGTHSDASCDYPTFAAELARRVAAGEAPWGLLVCGTGVGMAIAANKVPGVRAAVVSDSFSARATRPRCGQGGRGSAAGCAARGAAHAARGPPEGVRGRGGGARRGRVCGVTGHGAARAAARVFV